MINGLEGLPRSGKSYEATVYHVLPSLEAGRKVITNLPLFVEVFAAINPAYRDLIELRRRVQPVRGVWDASAVDEAGNGTAFTLFEDGHTEDPEAPAALFGEKESERRPVSLFGHVWDFYSPWKHPKTGQGPLFIIDECHVAFPKAGTDRCVVEWFKLHGHFNADVLLMTQNFRDMNQPIAGLVAILIKVRKADVLGRKDSYIRKVHAGYRGGVVSTDERDYRPQYFPLYKSHTQGNSVAEGAALDMVPFLVKFNRFKWLVVSAGGLACVYAWWPSEDKPKPPVARPAWLVDAAQAKQAAAAALVEPAGPVKTVTSMVGKQDADQPVGVNVFPEPYGLKGLHVTGQMTMRGRTVYVIAVSQNGALVTTVTSAELEAIGYKWKSMTDCVGSLQWKEKVRALTCDSPSITMDRQTTAAVKPQPVVTAQVTPDPVVSFGTGGGHGLLDADTLRSRNEGIKSANASPASQSKRE